jgi:hypothetical protein
MTREIRCRRLGLLLLIGGLVGSAAAQPAGESPAQPPKVATAPAEERPSDPHQREKLEFFRDRIGGVRLTVAARPDQPCDYIAEPLAKFDNPISHIEDGFMFLWTNRDRPVATVKSYHNLPNKTWGRTFVSLATRPIVMQREGQPLWTPDEAGVTFADLPDAPQPAAEARQRLVQMRAIARRFSVIDHWGITAPTDWQLRLLPTPLYRYEAKDDDVVDGALFGYVLTSPEALLLLEARKTDKGLAWQYAVARFTRFGVRFALDGKQIAEFDRLDGWPATGTYFHYPQPWEEYPFAEKPAAAERAK